MNASLARLAATLLLLLFAVAPDMALAACPGCCSSHGGITNSCASSGRVCCADGTVSPTCTCSSCGVPSAPTVPTCTGGKVWNGIACTCPSGQIWASIEQVCHAPIPASACGVERWNIKTGGDSEASAVITVPTPTMIDLLTSIPVPAGATTSPTRVAPIETSTFVLDGTLTDYRMNDDSDYHLVLKSSTGVTMIVEIPHPDCVSTASPFRSQIEAARAAVDAAVAPTRSFKATAALVRATGVGFWDSLHGQRGVAPNGIELHPVTAVAFNPTTPLPPPPAPTSDSVAVEYFHAEFGHYFITAFPEEAAAIDAGKVSGWARTGRSFKVNSTSSGTLSPVCRFFSTSFAPKSSHFYTPFPQECADVRTNPDWRFEAIAFYVQTPTTSGSCPTGTTKVYRLYNNGIGGAPNHRYTTSPIVRSLMIAEGWIPEGFGSEGVVFCGVGSETGDGSTAYQQTNRMLGGTWQFSYSFNGSHVDSFKLEEIAAYDATDSPWMTYGINRWGKVFTAGYVKSLSKLMLVSQTDSAPSDVFTFLFSSADRVSGCYYRWENPKSPLGPCYSFTGSRTASAVEPADSADSQPGLQEAVVNSHETTNSALDAGHVQQ